MEEYVAIKKEYDEKIKALENEIKNLKAFAEGKAALFGKKWYRSKTVWVNIIAMAGIVSSYIFGFEISGEEAAGILAVVNLVLRAVTKEPLTK